MAKKSIKNCKHVVDLIHHLTVPALRLLASVEQFTFLENLDWEQSAPEVRQAAVDRLAGLAQEQIVLADQAAIRVLDLAAWQGDELLDKAAAAVEFEAPDGMETFNPDADAFTRLIWLLAYTPKIFDNVETMFLACHRHTTEKYESFTVRGGEQREFVWDDKIGEQLQAQVADVLRLSEGARDSCEVIHFEMEDGEGESANKLHYLVVYHPGTMKSIREIKNRCRDVYAFYPALEATLVYNPRANTVTVLAKQQAARKTLADCFSKIGFDKPLSEQPLEQVFYDLSIFKTRVDLVNTPVVDAVIERAWVPSMTVSLGHTSHKVTLKMFGEADIWTVAEENFGEANPISRCRSVRDIDLSFVIRLDSEDAPRSLDFSVSNRGTCTLMKQSDLRVRRCGEEILSALGVMQRVDAAAAPADNALFLAELQLLDQPYDDVDGHLLRQLGLNATSLTEKGLIKKKDIGKSITVAIENDDESVFYRTLEIQSNSKRSWAADELTGREYDLDEDDLRRYTVLKGWLREQLTGLLSDQLTGTPVDPDPHEPYFLGYYRFGDQGIPVSLATQLWHDKHADAADIELRKQNLGVGIVLTTTRRRSRKFLASSLVMPIEALLDGEVGGVKLILSRLETDFRRWKGQSGAGVQPRLIKEDHGATLVGPWHDPWTLAKVEQIAAVETLVNAWNSGKRKCTTDEVLGDYGGRRSVPERFRDDPQWQTYIRGAVPGAKRHRWWELNIGTPQCDPVHDAVAVL